ncbi:LGFP repeat-containing protein [Rhodococcus jostii]|uniref:LGFP repeat-containing protein n=1 Tax=Rhodococcus jostii TaxID=132919 RepID=UPI00363D1566
MPTTTPAAPTSASTPPLPPGREPNDCILYEKYYVCGLILEKYIAMDGPRGSLGMPTSNEKVLPDQVGRVSVFEHGSIYWSPSSDAHPIRGRIGDKWGQKGWEGGFLHYPTSDELRNPDGRGLHQTFQGGSIYYSPETDAHSIGGLIRDKWAEKGWERGTLGYPTTDETGVTGGAFNHFQGGSIYWSSSDGAHPVWGAIRDKWAASGWERGDYRFPASDEFRVDGGWQQEFDQGIIAAPGDYVYGSESDPILEIPTVTFEGRSTLSSQTPDSDGPENGEPPTGPGLISCTGAGSNPHNSVHHPGTIDTTIKVKCIGGRADMAEVEWNLYREGFPVTFLPLKTLSNLRDKNLAAAISLSRCVPGNYQGIGKVKFTLPAGYTPRVSNWMEVAGPKKYISCE